MMTQFFTCDPDKNVNCKKTACYINGGPCMQTTNIAYAKNANVKLVIPMSQEEYDELMEAENE